MRTAEEIRAEIAQRIAKYQAEVDRWSFGDEEVQELTSLLEWIDTDSQAREATLKQGELKL